MDKQTTKTSSYQVIANAVLTRFEQPAKRLRRKRRKMKNPVYYRLTKDRCFAGFKREVTEWLPPGAHRWQLDPIPHDEDETQKLSQPAMGIATYGREQISTAKQRRVTHPESKNQDEPTGERTANARRVGDCYY